MPLGVSTLTVSPSNLPTKLFATGEITEIFPSLMFASSSPTILYVIRLVDTNTENWGPGSLIAGLPSNIVRDFLQLDSHLLIATHGGIGLYNFSTMSFDNPITSYNGLPSTIINT